MRRTPRTCEPRCGVARHDDEIKEGRGCGEHADHVLLKLDHLGPRSSTTGCPVIREIAIKFANVDPIREPIPGGADGALP
jgi:succinate dehydrogenase / fumarate reductase flavoprotein subunit